MCSGWRCRLPPALEAASPLGTSVGTRFGRRGLVLDQDLVDEAAGFVVARAGCRGVEGRTSTWRTVRRWTLYRVARALFESLLAGLHGWRRIAAFWLYRQQEKGIDLLPAQRRLAGIWVLVAQTCGRVHTYPVLLAPPADGAAQGGQLTVGGARVSYRSSGRELCGQHVAGIRVIQQRKGHDRRYRSPALWAARDRLADQRPSPAGRPTGGDAGRHAGIAQPARRQPRGPGRDALRHDPRGAGGGRRRGGRLAMGQAGKAHAAVSGLARSPATAAAAPPR
jgi:hypothetical protein